MIDWHAEPVGRLIVNEYDRTMRVYEAADLPDDVLAALEAVFAVASAFRQVRSLFEELGELE